MSIKISIGFKYTDFKDMYARGFDIASMFKYLFKFPISPWRKYMVGGGVSCRQEGVDYF